MQGSVWGGGLKCTTQMYNLNKIMISKEELTYKYRGDQNIPIGVLGMVDDMLAIAECGVRSVEKNAVVNSFMETQRLRMHKNKSVVIHVSNVKQCSQPCPQLKVHTDISHKVEKAEYLGNYLSLSGGVKDTSGKIITESLVTKKSRNLLGQKKIMQPLWTKQDRNTTYRCAIRGLWIYNLFNQLSLPI